MASSTTSDLARKLEQLDVPVSHDPCRACANPCDDVHGDWPPRFEVDMDSTLLGSTNPLHRQVVISTGQTDWAREVTEAPGTIAAILLKTREVLGPAPVPAPVPKGVPAPLPESSKMHGLFTSSDSNKLSILNGSHVTVAENRGDETVLLFPDYSMIVGVRATEDSVNAFYKTVLDSTLAAEAPFITPQPLTDAGLHVHVLPYACVIMLCSHKRRDNRCHIAAPKLEERFSDELERAGWEVHTRLHDMDHDHGHDANASRDDRLRAAASSHSALIVKTSHIGGHRYAGNVQIMFPQGSCIWYARVSPHEVHAVVQHTILGGKILPDLLRAGMNVVRAENKTLLDW